MTDATQVAPAAPREQGWAGVLLALAAFLLVPAIPVAGALFPVAQGWVLLLPALAACMLLGWWAGGRASLAIFWIVIAAFTVFAGPRSAWGAYGTLLRAWAVILAGAFGVLALVDTRRPLFSRALSAVAMTLVAALGITTALRAPASVVSQVVVEQLDRRNAAAVAQLRTLASEQPEAWSRFVANYPAGRAPFDDVAEMLATMTKAGAAAFPALLALQSLAALALAWALYHRLSRTRIGPPVAPLREFRFNDQLVWGLIVGLTVLLLPTVAPSRAAGFGMLRSFGVNLVVFFLSLYALRGLGVISWVLSQRTVWILVGLAVVLAQIPMMQTIATSGLLSLVTAAGLLGLADTWFDWRRLARPLP